MSGLLPGHDGPADDPGRAIVRRTYVSGVQSGPGPAGAEERRLDEQSEHWLREEEHDDQVEDRGTTILDLIIVFFFTKPVLALLVKTTFFGTGRPGSGLDAGHIGPAHDGASGVVRRPVVARKKA